MKVIKEYEVTIPQEDQDWLEANGHSIKDLAEACTIQFEAGECGTLVLFKDGERVFWDDSSAEDFLDNRMGVLYRVEDWNCAEADVQYYD